MISHGTLDTSLPEDPLTKQPDKELREQEKQHGDSVGAQGLAWQFEVSLVRSMKGVSYQLETGRLQSLEPCEEGLDPMTGSWLGWRQWHGALGARSLGLEADGMVPGGPSLP